MLYSCVAYIKTTCVIQRGQNACCMHVKLRVECSSTCSWNRQVTCMFHVSSMSCLMHVEKVYNYAKYITIGRISKRILTPPTYYVYYVYIPTIDR